MVTFLQNDMEGERKRMLIGMLNWDEGYHYTRTDGLEENFIYSSLALSITYFFLNFYLEAKVICCARYNVAFTYTD